MSKIKYVILFLILFLVIGFAAISVTLSVNGNVKVLSDLDDFKVYFSDVKVNGEQDLSLATGEQEIEFDFEFRKLGTTYVVDYDVTNASSVFDASLTIDCMFVEDDFSSVLSMVNNFDTQTSLKAKETRSGTLTLKKHRVNTDDMQYRINITCSINATAVGRTEEADNNVVVPLPAAKYPKGKEISIGTEKFNIVSENDDTVVLLAKYNLGTNYRQTTSNNYVTFSSTLEDWGPTIDIQEYTTIPKTYINEYVKYLKQETGDLNLSGDLATINSLRTLGCEGLAYDYLWTGQETCSNSRHVSWIVNGQDWWLKNADSDNLHAVWNVYGNGNINTKTYNYTSGIRPLITVSKKALENDYIVFYHDYIVTGISVDYNTFIALNGMTWSEWVDSEYNTIGATVDSNNVYIFSCCVLNGVVASDIIVDGLTYNTYASYH